MQYILYAYGREGYLSYYRLDHLLPPEVTLSRSEINLLHRTIEITHTSMRRTVATLAKYLSRKREVLTRRNNGLRGTNDGNVAAKNAFQRENSLLSKLRGQSNSIYYRCHEDIICTPWNNRVQALQLREVYSTRDSSAFVNGKDTSSVDVAYR